MRSVRLPRTLLALLVVAAVAVAGCAAGNDADASPATDPSAAGSSPAADTATSTAASADDTTSTSDTTSTGDADGDESHASGPTDEFPVVVEHAFGETTIEEEPTRVVALGWGTPESAIALGVTPVGVEEQVYTVGEDAHLPWIEEEVTARGEELPTLLTQDFTTPAYEEIVALEPDLILAHYSGYGQEAYELLSDIAPTVAYPQDAWSTPWRDVIAITGTALGRQAAADEVLADIEARLAGAADDHPEFADVTVANVYPNDGTVSVYTPADPRVQLMEDLGFTIADAVSRLDNDDAPSNFYYDLSAEEYDRLASDLLVTYHASEEEAETFVASEEAAAFPALAAGHVAQVTGTVRVSAVSPPTALSVPWGLDHFVDTLAAAVAE